MKSEFTGFKELQAKLEALGKKTGGKIARKALRDGAKVMQGYLRDGAPVDSGRTKAALKVRAGKRKRGRISAMVTLGQSLFTGETFYAGFVNWGWLTGKRGGSKRRKVEGAEWLEKAWARGAEATVTKVRERLGELLQEEAK